jgi:hypothetical protein
LLVNRLCKSRSQAAALGPWAKVCQTDFERFILFIYLFDAGSPHVAHAGLELLDSTILLFQPPQ